MNQVLAKLRFSQYKNKKNFRTTKVLEELCFPVKARLLNLMPQLKYMKKIIYSKHAPAPIGPYSQAVMANGCLYVSGQVAIDAQSGDMYTGGDIAEETKRVMENLKAIVEEAGCAMRDVVKCSIFLADMQDFATVNGVYGSYFPEYPPARETVQVSRLPKDARVEISAIVLCS